MKKILTFLSVLGLLLPAQAGLFTLDRTGLVGDSQLDFPTGLASPQGHRAWNHGIYNVTQSGTAFVPFPTDGSTTASAVNHWNGTLFDVFSGNPPWTQLGSAGGHPNGSNNGDIHYAVRRYTVGDHGNGMGSFNLAVDWFLRKSNSNGGGVTGYVYHNGTQVDLAAIAGNDTAGANRTLSLQVSAGDLIDIALGPEDLGSGTPSDGSDGSEFGATLRLADSRVINTIRQLADSRADFSGVQGQNGWQYGYHVVVDDQPTGGFTAFPAGHFTGTIWDVPAGNPPWTFISSTGGHPNGNNQAEAQWATRRYTVGAGDEGRLLVQWDLAKGGPSGTGTGMRVLVNDLLMDARGILGTDTTGITGGFVFDASAGDTIDFALSSYGFTGDGHDGSDSSLFGAQIFLIPEPHSFALVLLGGLLLTRRLRP